MNGRDNRVLRLTIAGATDSLGLACGWTVINLLAIHRHGLSGAALLNAAMLLGVALSSPAAAWSTRHVNGRHILQGTAIAEALLRMQTLALLLFDAPMLLIAALVLVTNVVAWIGYAGMRAEVARASIGSVAMTHYVAAIIAVEAVGTTVAALLPITPHGEIARSLVIVVIAVYGLSLVPTGFVARASTIPPSRVPLTRGVSAHDRRLLTTGTLLMIVCSGPTLLFIALAAKLHGSSAVAPAAICFAAGSLLAPRAGRLMIRTGLPLTTLWLTWGAGMLAGWIVAPWNIAGLCVALLVSGVCLAGFEGAMDSLLAGSAPDGRATASLAHGSAARALGGAVAVKLVPLFSGTTALAETAAIGVVACCAAALLVHRLASSRHVLGLDGPVGTVDLVEPLPVSR